jgi:hypothetical protein
MFDCRIQGNVVPGDLLGEFRDSTNICSDGNALRQRMSEDGYVFVRGLISPDAINDARREVFQRLIDVDEIQPPAIEGIATGRSRRVELTENLGTFWQSVSEGPALRSVSHAEPVQQLMTTLFDEPARGYDYIFLRPGVVGRFTFPHYDYPFFARGTKRVVTAWTAIGDVPTTEGSLYVVSNSHRFDDLINQTEQIDYSSTSSAQVQLTSGVTDFVRSRQAKLLTANFAAGDLIIFSMTTMHGTFDNCSPIGRARLTVDVRWQPAAEPIDERYAGPNPAGTTGIGYGELNGAKPLTQDWHIR